MTAVVATAGALLAALLLLGRPGAHAPGARPAATTLSAEARLMARRGRGALGARHRPGGPRPRWWTQRLARWRPGSRWSPRTAGCSADSAPRACRRRARSTTTARGPRSQEALAGHRPRRAPQRHGGHGAALRGRAGAPRRADRWASRASSRGIEAIEEQSRDLGGPQPSPWPWRSLATGLLSVLLSASLGRVLGADHGDRPAYGAGQPLGPHPGRPRGRARRAGADHQPFGRPAAGPPRRDRARPGPHRRHPLRPRRRRPRRGPRGTVLLANEPREGPGPAATPDGRHYLEVLRQSEVELAGRGASCAPASGARPRWRSSTLRRVLRHHGAPLPRRVEGTPHGAILTFNDATERHRARAHPPRLRGQRLPRAAHAAHLDPRLRRGPRGRRGRGARHGAALPRQDPHPRRPHDRPRRRPARAQPPRVGRRARRSGRRRCPPRWPTTSSPPSSALATRKDIALRRDGPGRPGGA